MSQNIFIQAEYKGRDILMVAESASMDIDPDSGQRRLVLRNGSRYEGQPGQALPEPPDLGI